KPTTIGKLARYFQKKGLSVGVVAADTHRPAAHDQLEQLADSIKVGFWGDRGEKDAVRVAKAGVKALEGTDVVLVDTSGRHALEAELIEEIKAVAKAVQPDETILVLDAATGQQAGPQAKAFHEAVGVTSVVLTKLDGSAKGGGALSAVAETKAPIVFVGVGEKIEDLEKFEPPRFISRLLGMGDLESLLEKAQEAIDEEAAEELAKKVMSGKFTLHEMYEQIEMLGKMGPAQKVLRMIPGVAERMKEGDLDNTQGKLRRFLTIMDSMTEKEMSDPKLVKSTRVTRIARGAGVTPRDVKELLKHYDMSRKAIKGFAGNRKMRKQLMKQLEASGVDVGEP
ncbi:MAG: signal recognition particle protein Srp19, partial [Methanobacteriota archaeon]